MRKTPINGLVPAIAKEIVDLARDLYLQSPSFLSAREISETLKSMGKIVHYTTINNYARKEKWKELKLKFQNSVKMRALDDISDEETRVIARLITAEKILYKRLLLAGSDGDDVRLAGLVKPYLDIRRQRIDEEKALGMYGNVHETTITDESEITQSDSPSENTPNAT